MHIAIVHDDLVQWGGAERILEGLCEIYPDAPIFTSVIDLENKEIKKRFGSKKIITSFLQQIPGWRSMYKTLLPLYPIALEQFNFDKYDLVVSHTTRFAKSIITKPQTRHICYCHTPPRFLWHFSGEKNYGLGEILMTKLRIYDQVSARRVDYFIAGSENAKRRIKRAYGVDSKIVYPFIEKERFQNVETFDGGYFAIVARLNRYKRLDLAEDACKQIDIPLKIISGGLDDSMVVGILAGCKALIIPGIEDFGLAALEAQALGKPVIAFREGGCLETVIDGKTGIFFENQTTDSLKKAIINLSLKKIKVKDCMDNAERFSKDHFIKNFRQTIASLMYT